MPDQTDQTSRTEQPRPPGIFCTDWRPAEAGKTKCASFHSGGLCSVPTRLRCIQWLVRNQDQTSIEELISHNEFWAIPVAINTHNRTGGKISIALGEAMAYAMNLLSLLPGVYSFSQLYSCYMQCPRMWWLEYVKRVKTVLRPHYFVVGNAGHAVLERFLSGMPIQDAVKFAHDFDNVQTGDEYFAVRIAGVKAACEAWASLNQTMQGCGDTEVKYEHALLPMRGYVDLRKLNQDGTKTLWEHKFAGDLKYQPKYRAQAMFYFGFEPDADACVINVLRKPNMRSHKKQGSETMDQYQKRMCDAMLKKPSDWFARYVIERSPDEERAFIEETTQIIDTLESARHARWNRSFFPKNYSHCCGMNGMDCQFRLLCETGQIDPKVYYVDHTVNDRDKVDDESDE